MKLSSMTWAAAALCLGLLCVPLSLTWAEGPENEDNEQAVSLSALPAVVRDAMVKASGGNALQDIERSRENGRTVYEADWTANGREMEIAVAADGRVLNQSEEKAEEDGAHEGDREAEPESHHAGNHAADAGHGVWADNFKVADCTFVSTGQNTYFILEPGYRLVLEHIKNNRVARLEITVLNETRKIDNVETRVVEERETLNGQITELSRNYLAICKETGSIFYFGEESSEYRNGAPQPSGDSWMAGSENAKPGLYLPGVPVVGARYYQELAPGKAMDRAEIVSTSERVQTPAGAFEHCLKAEESSPLERGEKEYKVYAPGVGLIQDEDLVLTQHGYLGK